MSRPVTQSVLVASHSYAYNARHALRGKNNREIADVLCISLSTVTTNVHNILTKTGTANRTEAAAYALRHGQVLWHTDDLN